jgi:hypothetical protein
VSDLGFGDVTSIWFVQVYDGWHNFIDYMEANATEIADSMQAYAEGILFDARRHGDDVQVRRQGQVKSRVGLLLVPWRLSRISVIHPRPASEASQSRFLHR